MAIIITPNYQSTDVTHVQLSNSSGVRVELVSYAASLYDWWTPLANGTMESILCRPTQLDDFITSSMHYGRTIGRTAGRLFDRVLIGNETYDMGTKGVLHGGKRGFSWSNFALVHHETCLDFDRVVFEKTIHDQEDGFPGTMTLRVTYTLTHDHRLITDFDAISDRTTLCNITHHPYFNLSASESTILDHELQLPATAIVATDAQFKVSGLAPLSEGFDMNQLTLLRTHWKQVLATPFHGYDHFFQRDSQHPIRLHSPSSGRTLTIDSPQPYCVIFSHNFVLPHAMNRQLNQYGGLAIEPQGEPYHLARSGPFATQLEANTPYHTTITYRVSGGGLPE